MPIHFYESNADQITARLFLGNYIASQSHDFIRNNNIKAIIQIYFMIKLII